VSTSVDTEETLCYNPIMPTDTIAAENLEVDSTELSNIGERIRSFRLARNWTLDQLATRSALSKSYISRLEDGDRHPSIASLLSITRAMNISLGQLLTDGKSSPFVSIVRGDQIPATPGNGLSYQVHSNGFPGAVMQPIRITISASRTGSELYRHEGEEWLFVLSGKLAVTLGSDSYVLNVGDSIHFDATIGHRLAAEGGKDVDAILVASAAQRSLLNSYR